MADAGDRVILWGDSLWESPWVFSAFVALEEKGIPYEVRLLSLAAGDARSPDFARASLTGRVPALQHGDFWLSESSAIGEYLDEAFPPPRWPRLYPEGTRDRARARQVQAWLRTDLVPLRQARPTSSIFLGDKVRPLPPEAREAADRLCRVADQLLAPGSTSLFGGFGPADADLALMLQRLLHNGDPLPDRLAAYARAAWARPSVRKYAGQPRPRPPSRSAAGPARAAASSKRPPRRPGGRARARPPRGRSRGARRSAARRR